MKKNIIVWRGRQGDVLLSPIDKIPENAKLLEGKGPVVLAYGEHTGHHHVVLAGAKGYKSADAADSVTEAEYLAVESALTHLDHRDGTMTPTIDHKPIEVPKGNYEVVIQSEYVAQAFQRVHD